MILISTSHTAAQPGHWRFVENLNGMSTNQTRTMSISYMTHTGSKPQKALQANVIGKTGRTNSMSFQENWLVVGHQSVIKSAIF